MTLPSTIGFLNYMLFNLFTLKHMSCIQEVI